MLLPVIYGNGHLATVLRGTETMGWIHAFAQPWLIAARADAGRVQEAMDLLQEVRSRSVALLAYLLTRPQRRAERDELLDVLFEGKADDSARAYLRQAVRWLRTVLPPEGVISERTPVELSKELAAVSESVQLESALAEAARLRGTDRLRATLAALEIIDRGPYLPGIASQWLDDGSCRPYRDIRASAEPTRMQTGLDRYSRVPLGLILT